MTGGSKVIFGILKDQRRKIRLSPHCGIIKVTNMLKAISGGGRGKADAPGFFRLNSLVIPPLCYFLKLIVHYPPLFI